MDLSDMSTMELVSLQKELRTFSEDESSLNEVLIEIGKRQNEPGLKDHKEKCAYAIKEYIYTNNLTQSDASDVFGLSQPEISCLLNNKLEIFSLSRLFSIASKHGLVKLTIVNLQWADSEEF